MRANLNYAQVYNGVVEAVCVGDNWEEVNAVARCAFGEEAFAVDVTYCHVSRGDLYHDGCFWRVNEETGEEKMIPFEATEAEEIAVLKEKNTQLTSDLSSTMAQLTDTQLALTEQYEENIALQEEVTNTQLALTELYEVM